MPPSKPFHNTTHTDNKSYSPGFTVAYKKSSSLAAAVIFIIALSAVQTIIHNWFVDTRVIDAQKSLHQQVLSGEAPAPIQYRIFVHHLAQWLINNGFSFVAAYDTIRFIFTFLSALVFYIFISKWFKPESALLGVMIFFAFLPLTYIRYYFQPMDIPNLFFFIAGLAAVRRKNFPLFLIILAVAMTNRETAILLVLIWLLVHWDKNKNSAVIIQTALAAAMGLGIYFYLRKIYSLKHYYSDLFYLRFNLTDGRTYLYAAVLIGPLIFYALKNFKSKPEFLRRSVLILPFFLVIHYTMTIMAEPRLWLPVVAILIPMALWSLTSDEQTKHTTASTPGDENLPSGKSASHPARQKSILLYCALFAAFMTFFVGFFTWYEKSHLGKRTEYTFQQEILARANALSSGGWDEEAVKELERGAALFPTATEFYYRAGLIYAYRIFNYEQALYNFKKTLELEPNHLDSRRIKAEIERFEYILRKKNSAK